MSADLIQRALQGLSRAQVVFPRLRFELGGGAVLGERYGHRRSLDVDFFISDVQALPSLSPRLNGSLARGMSDYDEGSSAVEIRYPNHKLHFIVAPDLTELPPSTELIFGISVVAQATPEIIAKKILYRSADMPIRDVFDIAVLLQRAPEMLVPVIPFLEQRRTDLLRRLAELALSFEERCMRELLLEPAGEALVAGSLHAVQAWATTSASGNPSGNPDHPV